VSSDVHGLVQAVMAAQNERAWDRLRAFLSDDFLFSDHRPTSFGGNEGPDGWIRILQVAIELVADRMVDVIEPVAGGPPGLMHMKASGTDEYGGSVEWDFLASLGVRDGRLTHLDVFALEQADEAVARARELSAPE
jgi:hypothetical protein